MLKKILVGATFLSLASLVVSSSLCAQEKDWLSVAGEATAALTGYCTALKDTLSSTVPSLKDALTKVSCEGGQEVIPSFLVGLVSMENKEILKSIHNIQEELNYLDGFCAEDAGSDGCVSYLRHVSADTLLDYATYLKGEANKLDASVLAADIRQTVEYQNDKLIQDTEKYLAMLAAHPLHGGTALNITTSQAVGWAVGGFNNYVGFGQLGMTAWRMGPEGGLFTQPGALLGADIVLGAGYGYFVAPWVKNAIQTYWGYSEFIADRLTYGIKDFVFGAEIAWYLGEGIELYSSLSSLNGKKAAIINPVAWGLLTALGNGFVATVFDYLGEGPAKKYPASKENNNNNDL